MSTTIDQRVVEMRFDNKQFESNVSTTMSTLDKLKQKLHLDGATKGLENVDAASRKVNMSGLSGAVETVSAKFSALEVMGVTALANITNSAVNAGKRIVSALTIDPIKTGLSEYETKINAIQVIQANTRGKNTMDDITAALDDLNEYADKTIYNFAQMTNNIGKFTAQGYDVHEAANAVKGLANLAAASGASAEDMARATYQMSQAMGGTIRLMDWNSLRNANMATQELKNTLIDLAKVNGIAIDDMIEKHGTFEQTLSEGWLSGDMFTEAMNIYSGIYSDAELAAKGFTKEQITNFKELAAMAESAATEVKTFTQLWDVLKETAQSGWTQTWEIIVGDFATAKAMWTNLQNYFGDIINGWADIRNALFGGAFNLESPWAAITEKLEKSGLNKVVTTIENATDKLEHFKEVVGKVWHGDYKNSDTGRFNLLEEAGYDHRVVQELVNLKKRKWVDDHYEYYLTLEDVEAAHKKFGLTMEETTKVTEKASVEMNKLSDEELKNAGLTEGEIRLYRALAEEADRTGVSIGELAEEMSKNDGRTMMIDSIKNAWSGFVTVLKAVADAWKNVFPPITVVQLYSVIKAINEFSEKLKVGDETAKNIRQTFEGVFAVLDVITTILGGGVKIAFKAITQLLEYFDTDILSVTASLGKGLVKFRDWVDASLDFKKVYEKIIPPIVTAIKSFKEWIGVLKKSENLPRDIAEGIVGGFGKALNFVKSVIKELVTYVKTGFKQVPEFMNSGLINGIWKGIQTVGQVIIELGKIILEKIKGVLGIHSPSTEFYEIGSNVIQGLVNGLKAGMSSVSTTVKKIGTKCIEALKGIDFGSIFVGALVIGGLVAVTKIADAIGALAAPFAGFGDMLEEFGDAAKNMSKGVKNFLNAQALLSIAVAIGILAASVAMMAKIDTGKLWGAIGALAALVGIVVLLSLVTSKLNAVSGLKINAKDILILIAISGALLILSLALAKLAKIDASKIVPTLILFGSLLLGMLALSKIASGASMVKIGGTLLAMSAALLILTGVFAILSTMDSRTIVKGLAVLTFFGAFVLGLIGVAALCRGNVAVKMGGTLLAISVSLLIMTVVIRQIAKLDDQAITKGIKVIAVFGGMVLALVAVVGLLGGNVAVKMGGTLFSFALALIIMVSVIKIISGMDAEGIKRGLTVIAVLELLFMGMVAVSAIAGKNAAKAGVMLLAMSAAMLILAGVLFIISLLDPSGVMRALFVVAVIEALMIGLVAATKNAQKCTGAIIALGVIMVLLAAAVVALTFVDESGLKTATAVISAIMISFGILLSSLGKIKNAKSLWSALVPMVILIGALTGVVAILARLQPGSSIENAAALSILMIALSASLVILDKVKSISASAIAGLGAMAVVAALGGLILAMMSALKTDNAIENAIGLGILINTMATALLIADKVKSVSVSAMVGLMAISVAAALGGLVLAMMSALKTDNAIENAIGLGILLNAMATAMLIASMVGGIALAGVGCLALMALVAAEAGLVFAMMTALGVEDALPNAIALSTLLLAMSAALVVLSVVGAVAPAALAGMGLLALFVAEVALLIGGIGALMTEFPQLEEFVDKGIPMLEKLGNGIGSFVGNIIGGVLEGITDSLPGIADNLSDFANRLNPFIDGIKDIDGESVSAVGRLAEIVVLLTAANIMDGLTSWLTGGSSFVKFGEQLAEFGPYLKKYSDSVSGINVEAVNTSATAVEALAKVASALPNSGGVAGWFAGNNDIDDFGKQLKSFGGSLMEYTTSISGLTESDAERVQMSANITKALGDVAKELPNAGGVAGWFAGNNDMDTFGTSLASYGASLMLYLSSIAGLTEDDVEKVKMSATMTKKLGDVAKELPNAGGVASWFAGNNNMDTFGISLASYGGSLLSYTNSIAGLTEDDVSRVEISASITKALGEMAKDLPNSGGVAGWFAGNNDLDAFGEQLKIFGGYLVEYSTIVTGINPESILVSSDAANSVVSVASSIAAVGGVKELKMFGENLCSFATHLKTYADSTSEISVDSINASNNAMRGVVDVAVSVMDVNFEGMKSLSSSLGTLGKSLKTYSAIDYDKMSSVNGELNNLVDLTQRMSSSDFSGLGSLAETLGEVGEVGMSKFMTAFDGASEKTANIGTKMIESLISAIKKMYSDLTTEGKNVAKKFKGGIEDVKQEVVNSFKTMVQSAIDATKTEERYESYKRAGAYMVIGFIAGIDSKIDAAARKAAQMAAAAIEAAKAELDEHSPSRVFYGIGDYAGQGFVNALGDYGDKSYDAGAEVADSAKRGLSGAIAKIWEALDSDMDTEPTIRPVVDLSNVRSGADAINSMFGVGSSVGVLSAVGSINSSMNVRGQNGGNDELLRAINKLHDDFKHVGNTTYQINGVTYDDGSNLKSAVESIVRAARVERRV